MSRLLAKCGNNTERLWSQSASLSLADTPAVSGNYCTESFREIWSTVVLLEVNIDRSEEKNNFLIIMKIVGSKRLGIGIKKKKRRKRKKKKTTLIHKEYFLKTKIDFQGLALIFDLKQVWAALQLEEHFWLTAYCLLTLSL